MCSKQPKYRLFLKHLTFVNQKPILYKYYRHFSKLTFIYLFNRSDQRYTNFFSNIKYCSKLAFPNILNHSFNTKNFLAGSRSFVRTTKVFKYVTSHLHKTYTTKNIIWQSSRRLYREANSLHFYIRGPRDFEEINFVSKLNHLTIRSWISALPIHVKRSIKNANHLETLNLYLSSSNCNCFLDLLDHIAQNKSLNRIKIAISGLSSGSEDFSKTFRVPISLTELSINSPNFKMEDFSCTLHTILMMKGLKKLLIKSGGVQDGMLNELLSFIEKSRENLSVLEDICYEFPRFDVPINDASNLTHCGKSVKSLQVYLRSIKSQYQQVLPNLSYQGELTYLKLSCFLEAPEKMYKRWMDQITTNNPKINRLDIDLGQNSPNYQMIFRSWIAIANYLPNLEELNLIGNELIYGSDYKENYSPNEALKSLSVIQKSRYSNYKDNYEYMGSFLSSLVNLRVLKFGIHSRGISYVIKEMLGLKNLEELEIIHNQYTISSEDVKKAADLLMEFKNLQIFCIIRDYEVYPSLIGNQALIEELEATRNILGELKYKHSNRPSIDIN